VGRADPAERLLYREVSDFVADAVHGDSGQPGRPHYFTLMVWQKEMGCRGRPRARPWSAWAGSRMDSTRSGCGSCARARRRQRAPSKVKIAAALPGGTGR